MARVRVEKEAENKGELPDDRSLQDLPIDPNVLIAVLSMLSQMEVAGFVETAKKVLVTCHRISYRGNCRRME